MTTEKQTPIIICRDADQAAPGVEPSIMRIVLFIILGVIAANTSGCATMSLWQKERTVGNRTLHTRYANLNNIFTIEAKEDVQGQARVYFLFKAMPSIRALKTFPPFEEGYLVLLPGPETETMIRRINGLKTELKPDESLYISKVKVYEISNPKGDITNELSMEVVRKYGGGVMGIYQLGTTVHGGAEKFSIQFANTLKSDDGEPIPINVDMSAADLIFFKCSRDIGAYKNPSAVSRIVGTPFAVAIDVVTFPLQLIAFLTVPLWMPK